MFQTASLTGKSAVIDGERDQHCHGSKPTCVILFCPWERHFKAVFPAWRSW